MGLVGPMWLLGGPKLLLGVAALVWPCTWRMGGMQWPRVLREGDVTGWPQWRRGRGEGFHICSCSAASHCTGDLGLGLCVTPWGVHAPGMAGSSSRAEGDCYQGLGSVLQHGILQRTWPQVVLLHLGSTEGHQEQPCVSITARVGLRSARFLSQGSPHPSPALGPRQSSSHGCAMCLCAGCTHLPHAPSLIHNLFVSIAARARFFKLNQM